MVLRLLALTCVLCHWLWVCPAIAEQLVDDTPSSSSGSSTICSANFSHTCKVPFVAFVPCQSEESDIEGCDSLVCRAIVQAVEDVNTATTVTRNGREETFNLKMMMTTITTNNNFDEALYSYFTEHKLTGSTVGIVGPRNNQVTETIAYIFSSRIPTVTVSYGATDVLFRNDRDALCSLGNRSDDYTHLYRTIPSERALNRARLALMKKFNWKRMAILASTKDRSYARAATDLACLFRLENYNVTLNYLSILPMDVGPIFKLWVEKQFKIIILLVPPQEARQLFCQAMKIQDPDQRAPLDPTHAWILPQYESPRWWEMTSEPYPNCSNSDMLELLNTINLLTVDSLKYNLFGGGGSGNHGYVLDRDWESLIRSVTNVTDRKESLQNFMESHRLRQSLMAAAYDSVWALALAVHQGRVNSSYSMDLKEHIDGLTFTGTAMSHSWSDSDEKSTMFLVSQFRGGDLHPIWLVREILDNVEGTICEADFKTINSTTVLPGFTITENGDVMWQGDMPTDGTKDSFISKLSLGIAVMLDVISLSLCVTMLIVMVIFRRNKYMKSSSVKFMAVAMVAYMSTIPANILTGLIYSAVRSNFDDLAKEFLCTMSYPVFFTGWCITIAILIAKSIRIYKIFHHSLQHNNEVSGVSDFHLVVYVLLLVLPFIVIVTVWYSISRPKLEVVRAKLYRGDELNWSRCITNDKWRWLEYLALSYFSFLLLFLSYLSYKNSLIRVPQFKEEGQSCARSAVAAIMGSMAVLVIYTPVREQVLHVPLPPHEIIFWSITAYVTISPITIFGALFVPKYVFIYRDYRTRTKEKRRRKTAKALANILYLMENERDRLKMELRQKSERIEYLKSGEYSLKVTTV